MRRTLTRLVLLAGAGLALTACAAGGAGSGSPSPSATPVTLADLTGTWTLTALSAVDGDATPVTGAPITLEIDGDRASGSDGCNSYTGQVAVEDGGVTFGPLASTRKMCIDPAVMTMASQYLAAMDQVTAASVTAGTLILTGEGTGLTFETDRP